MIPTETLITTIVADHAAQRDADPQAVIARLKQDLRAARQAATKARNYAERVRDGRAIPEEIAELHARIARHEERHREARASYMRLLRRTQDAEREIERLDAELASQSAIASSGGTDDDVDMPRTVFALEYLELIRAHKLVKALYAAPDGQYAAVANRMLSMIASICAAVEPKAGKGRDAA